METRVAKLEKSVRELGLEMEKSCTKLNEIHNFLMGSEYQDELNGGFIKQVKMMRASVDSLLKFRIRIQTRSAIIAASISIIIAVVGLLFTYFNYSVK